MPMTKDEPELSDESLSENEEEDDLSSGKNDPQ